MQRPAIVVLDGYALNPGDISWEAVESLGDCTIHDWTAPDQTVERARGAAIVLTNKTILDRTTLEQLPDLRYIGVLATGYNVVDLEAATELGIVVTNVPEYSSDSVAEMTFALIFELTRQVGRHGASVRSGRWEANRDFCFWETPLVELAGLTLGCVGCGRIGQRVIAIGRAFNMNTMAYHPDPARVKAAGAEYADLDRLFAASDIVTLHCPLTPDTRHLVNRRRLSLMRPTAFLINTGRGPLVDDGALAEALTEGRIAGAGLDVLTEEPPRAGNPLIGAPNCIITPHIAWATPAARRRLMTTVAKNIAAFLTGTPVNVVTIQ